VDFDNDGFITPQDIRIVLKHIPWVDTRPIVPSDEPQFMTQVLANSQIEKYLADLNKYMRGKVRYDFQDFVRMNSDFSSDLFISVLTLLHSQIPCSHSFYKYFQNFRIMQRLNKLGHAPKTTTNRSPVKQPNLAPPEDDDENDNTFYTTPKSFETYSNYLLSQHDSSSKHQESVNASDQIQFDKLNFMDKNDEMLPSGAKSVINSTQEAKRQHALSTQNQKVVKGLGLTPNSQHDDSLLLPKITFNNPVAEQASEVNNGGFSNQARLANQQMHQFPGPIIPGMEGTPINLGGGGSVRNDQLYYHMKRLHFTMKECSNTPSAGQVGS
jgi:hypothetical protein